MAETANVSDHVDPRALGLAFTSSAMPQWLFDLPTLRIVAVNEAATVHYGHSAADFTALTVLQLHPREEQDTARVHLCDAASATSTLHPKVWRHLTSGGERRVRMAFSDVTVEAAAARLVHVFDVTAEVRQQEEQSAAARRAADAAARADKVARGALLATVGRELRQPLTPMLPAMAVMEQRISPDVGVRAREVIKRQLGVQARLVDDLLDAAHAQQGKVTLQRETRDLRRLVEEIVAGRFSDTSALGLVFDTRFPAAPVWVSVDAARFHQVLSTLLVNAVNHSEPGGRIRVRVDTAGAEARLVVSDEGAGVDENVLPHLVEPFADAAPASGGAFGIGLYVVTAIVELHGGRVTAGHRRPGRGAELTVSLPVCPRPLAPATSVASDLRSVAELIRVRAGGGEDPLDGALADSDTALLIANDSSRLVNANPAALRLTGYEQHDLEALHVMDILAMKPSQDEDYRRAFVVVGRHEGILVLRRKDGTRLPVRYCAIRNVRPGLHLSALDAL
jgi:PAS domain S-box-containing protein